MNAMSKTARILDKICGFAYWTLVLAAVIILFGAGFLAISIFRGASLLPPSGSFLLSFGGLELLLAPNVMQEITSPGYEPWLLGIAVLVLGSLVVYFLMVQTVRDILRPFIDRAPFHETVARDLKRLSVLLVIETLLSNLGILMLDHVAQTYLDLNKLFLNGEIFGDRIITVGLANSTIEMTPYIFAAALYLLSKVFLYGQELQALSDETL